MTNELSTILIGAAIFAGRLWSAFEHKMTGKGVKENADDIREIKISLNGELEKRLQAEYERGVQDGKKSKGL